jgi:hypothetical protein
MPTLKGLNRIFVPFSRKLPSRTAPLASVWITAKAVRAWTEGEKTVKLFATRKGD